MLVLLTPGRERGDVVERSVGTLPVRRRATVSSSPPGFLVVALRDLLVFAVPRSLRNAGGCGCFTLTCVTFVLQLVTAMLLLVPLLG